jgi:uncharacterized membrane protein YbaN (DUF454 family)
MIGLLLPVMPTTPFLIVTAYCFSKGSEKLHRWLLTRPHIGPRIEEWEKYGIIRKQAKIFSTVVIVISFSTTIIVTPIAKGLKVMLACIGTAAIIFIWSRPSLPPSDRDRLP